VSDRICYLESTGRGAVLKGVRLTGIHADDRLETDTSGAALGVLESVDQAAGWIKSRLRAGSGSSRRLDALCLDADGSVCSWARGEDADAELIRSAVDQYGAEGDDDTLEGAGHSTLGERFPDLPLEVDYQPLDPSHASKGARRAVLATPDVPARLLLDRLDAMGIRVGRVETIWHQIARAWDPGAPHRSSVRDSTRVVSSEEPLCAAVVVDHERSRALWVWSRLGALIAAGSMRLAPGAEDPFDAPAMARLVNDWLGWSAQLGVSPRRVVLVAPDGASAPSSGLSARVERHWPDATTDLIVDHDPVLTTIRANIDAGAGEGIGPLTHRRGRAHRSMYRWGAGALLMGAALVGVGAYLLLERAGRINDDAAAIERETFEELSAFDPAIANSPFPQGELRQRLRELSTRAGPIEVTESKPMMEALEALSFVIGMPGIEVRSIDLTITSAQLSLFLDDLALAERINEALRSIEGSGLEWSASPDLTTRGERIQAVYRATWDGGPST